MFEIITIDGPASSGKSTLAKKISKHYDSPLLNSGKLYRAVALKLITKKIDTNDKTKVIEIAKSLSSSEINSNKLFSSEISLLASQISKEKYLRDQLKDYQREFPKKHARGSKFAVVEGRDIGTEIFSDAKFKIFIWADARIRAKRRYEQIIKNGGKTSLKTIYNEIISRDRSDLNRKVAPLKPAVNSVLLDTSYLDIEQSFNVIKKLINKNS